MKKKYILVKKYISKKGYIKEEIRETSVFYMLLLSTVK